MSPSTFSGPNLFSLTDFSSTAAARLVRTIDLSDFVARAVEGFLVSLIRPGKIRSLLRQLLFASL